MTLSRAFERGDFSTMVGWADSHIPALLGTRREDDVTPCVGGGGRAGPRRVTASRQTVTRVDWSP